MCPDLPAAYPDERIMLYTMLLNKYSKRAITGGGISLLVILLGSFLMGKLSGYEAKVLIQNSISGLNTLCNTIALASATILALLLTLLSISATADSKLKKAHYINVIHIAKLDTAVFIASVVAFLLFNLPITESENVPANWFNIIYYFSLGISSVLSAALIMVVIMLYDTVLSIITIVGLGNTDHPLAETSDEDDPKK